MSLGWSFGDGQKVTRLWDASYAQDGSGVTATNLGWNGKVAAGSSVSFGFTGSWSGSKGRPTAFKLGGRSCTVA
ncbi:cellulose binding domain-containing protein [Streptomyces avermitilis]|uniref:cellulose binding domain-containing protein n=1 Tax=Streptomyces avermitilis TaxID=33903 RepID=UPI00340E5157